MSVFTYKQAGEEFAKARDKTKGKLLADNTRLVAREGYFAIVYHKTEIVKIYPNDTYELNSGGWHTYSTKERLNTFSPVNLHADKGLWYFNGNIYEDGIRVDAKGKPVSKVKKASDVEAKKRALDKAIKGYITRFCDHLKEEGVDDPGPGDCWLCGLLSGMGQTDHLITHMEDDYFVPRLLLEAVSEHCTGISWQSATTDAEKNKRIGYRWMSIKREGGGHWALVALRRFFTRRKPELMKHFDPEQFEKNRKAHLKEQEEA